VNKKWYTICGVYTDTKHAYTTQLLAANPKAAVTFARRQCIEDDITSSMVVVAVFEGRLQNKLMPW